MISWYSIHGTLPRLAEPIIWYPKWSNRSKICWLSKFRSWRVFKQKCKCRDEVSFIFPLFDISKLVGTVETQIKITGFAAKILEIVDSIVITTLTMIYWTVWSLFMQLMAAWTRQNVLWSANDFLMLTQRIYFQK